MKIIRVSDTSIGMWELVTKLNDKNINNGDLFGISWKKGKSRKLKSYRLIEAGFGKCECCGSFTTLSLSKGKTCRSFDNHMGISSVSLTSF